MNNSFKLVNDLVTFLDPLDIKWILSGGWAIDVHLNRITRERCDLDISVPYSDRLIGIEFFLKKDWQIEGKLFDGFKTLSKISDYDEGIHYFWSFPKGVEFISEYVDDRGNRRIAYNRKTQSELDYLEVFLDRIEDGQFIYRRDQRIKRRVDRAILERNGVRYLAPELVLLFKSKNLSGKNLQDFNTTINSITGEALVWLNDAISLLYGSTHAWLAHLQAKTQRNNTK